MAKGRRFRISRIILVVFLATAGYIGFRMAQVYYYVYVEFGQPKIISDTAIRNAAYPVISQKLPEQSHHLYYARKGYREFLAFSLNSQKECEQYLERNFDAPLQKFNKISDLPAYPPKSGPHIWGEKFKDPNWQIDQEKGFYFYERYCLQVAYIPDKCRMYFFRWLE